MQGPYLYIVILVVHNVDYDCREPHRVGVLQIVVFANSILHAQVASNLYHNISLSTM